MWSPSPNKTGSLDAIAWKQRNNKCKSFLKSFFNIESTFNLEEATAIHTKEAMA